jgi:hypothetical protein
VAFHPASRLEPFLENEVESWRPGRKAARRKTCHIMLNRLEPEAER